MFKNTPQRYGIVSRVFHWLSAVVIIGLFALGVWMVELNYYDAWYTKAPYYHNGIGILLGGFTLARWLWRLYSPPTPLNTLKKRDITIAHYVHLSIYWLIAGITITGYLLLTADNRALTVFDWFSIPSLGALVPKQADTAGFIHKVLAYILIAFAIVHIAGALKHHFINKDVTLKRML